ncbi:MAG: repair protein [Chitinophagaceae bacterium]|nr:repair protein [Chitinophagaceae bacterium]
MLNYLHIKNYALIEELEWHPGEGFNTITGETGAGKSILLGALGLLLGNRADSKVLFDETQKCIIEGYFDLKKAGLGEWFEQQELENEEQTILRREVSSNGKSRAFINDTPVTLEVLKSLTEQIIDVHSQHETLLLGLSEFQVRLLDTFAGSSALYLAYRDDYRKYRNSFKTLEALQAARAQANKERDFNQYLYTELEEVAPQPNEQEQLEEEQQLLENAESIKEKLFAASELLTDEAHGSIQSLKESLKNLQAAAAMSTHFNSLASRLEGLWIELKDVSAELEQEQQAVLYDPARLSVIQERLSKLYALQKKHQVKSVAELITLFDELGALLGKMDDDENRIKSLEKEVGQLEKEVLKKAETLSKARHASVVKLAQGLVDLLVKLGMPDASVKIDIDAVPPGLMGTDKVNIRFSANKGVAPQELKQAASGGEFSRLMLAVKVILAEKSYLPTLIFDEIDTGVSGEIALRMGQMMKSIAQGHQVMTITHLPQVASLGDRHFYVYKNNEGSKTATNMKLLNEEERIQEIAQMIAGKTPSEVAVRSARELLGVK